MGLALTVLAICALICFLLGTVRAQPSAGRDINWVSAGLGLLTLAYLAGALGGK